MKRMVIDPKIDLVFSDKVREMCYSCKRYGSKASCPPHVGTVKYYKRLLPGYKHGILCFEEFHTTGDWQTAGSMSSMTLHKEILEVRKQLRDEGHYFVLGFGGGSCKFCDKCSFPCAHPDKALIPVEATGLDVVELMRRVAGITLKFPVKESFYRVGVVLYD